MNKNEAFRKIPKMDTILAWPETGELEAKFGRVLVKETLTLALELLRGGIQQGDAPRDTRHFLLDSAAEMLRDTVMGVESSSTPTWGERFCRNRFWIT